MEHILDDSFARHVNAWCGLHGLMYTDGATNWYPAPISLVPSPFSKSAFDYAQAVQPIWHKLMDRIARDRPFLLRELAVVGDADDFTNRLIQLYQSIPAEVLAEGLQFGIFRSDYMLNHDSRLLQVEINTIAASFGCLSKKVRSLHDHLLHRFEDSEAYRGLLGAVLPSQPQGEPQGEAAALRQSLQDNYSLENLASSIAAAHRVFDEASAVVLFVVQPAERNQADQRALESELWEKHAIKADFLTLAQVSEACAVDPSNGQLSVTRGSSVHPVSVVYYRAGYTPNDYPSELQWAARALLEGSTAIKCPNVGYHLAGCKAVQAALCKPGVLERYLTPEESSELRRCFARQYSLGDQDVHELAAQAMADAMADGKDWVLKPQREGGGNNYYNQELSAFLREHQGQPMLSGYVLMQRIFPQQATTAFYRQGKTLIDSSISELGIYGAYLGFGGQEDLLNKYCGYLLRTKGSGVDEGGVATGYSVLNSVTLIDK